MGESLFQEVLREIRVVRERIERVEELVEERLIGVEEPLKDEGEAIKEYEEMKRKGKLELTLFLPLQRL